MEKPEIKFKVYALFPTAEYEVDTYEEVMQLKKKEHKVLYLYNNFNAFGHRDSGLIVIKANNTYHRYILDTEEKIEDLDIRIKELDRIKTEELRYAGKLLTNFLIATSKTTSIYQNIVTKVIVKYHYRRGCYTVYCDKQKYTVNVLGNIELVILRLLYDFPIIANQYIIIHDKQAKGTLHPDVPRN